MHCIDVNCATELAEGEISFVWSPNISSQNYKHLQLCVQLKCSTGQVNINWKPLLTLLLQLSLQQDVIQESPFPLIQ